MVRERKRERERKKEKRKTNEITEMNVKTNKHK